MTDLEAIQILESGPVDREQAARDRILVSLLKRQHQYALLRVIDTIPFVDQNQIPEAHASQTVRALWDTAQRRYREKLRQAVEEQWP